MKTLLVLEDEPHIMVLLCRILNQYTIIEAVTAEEALLLFIDLGHQVDLLVADLTLPRMSGAQVALHLRSRLPDLPVILTSGYPVGVWKDRDCRDLEKLGSHSVTILQKPFRAEVIRNAVWDLIGDPLADKATTAN
jgi:CheY-like chemotaxis protein